MKKLFGLIVLIIVCNVFSVELKSQIYFGNFDESSGNYVFLDTDIESEFLKKLSIASSTQEPCDPDLCAGSVTEWTQHWLKFAYIAHLKPECKYHGTGEYNNDPIDIVITGYYKVCNNTSVKLEIVDVVPYPRKGYTMDCLSEFEGNDNFAEMVKLSHIATLEAIFAASQVSGSGIPFPTNTDEVSKKVYPKNGTYYEFISKPCWHKVLVAWQYPKEQDDKLEWKYTEPPVVLVPKVNTKMNDKNDEKLQEIDLASLQLLWTYEACTTTSCCEYIPTITWDTTNGKIIEMKYNSSASPVNCNYGTCVPLCEKIFTTFSVLTQTGILNSKVQPNPNNGNMTLVLDGSTNGDLNLQITDINGNIIIQKAFNKSTDQYSLELNLQSLINGNYYYKVLSGTSPLTNGGFTVQK